MTGSSFKVHITLIRFRSSLPVEVELVDVVEVTGCKETKTKTDGNKLNLNQVLNYCVLHEDNINYEQLWFNIIVQSSIMLTCSRAGRCCRSDWL